MAYDPKTNKITLGENSSFIGDSSKFFVTVIKDLAEQTGDPSLVADWEIIAKWLGCKDRELNSEDFEKIEKAYRAYLHFASTSSLERQVAFHDKNLDSKIQFLPPKDVQGVFRRMVNSSGGKKGTEAASIKRIKNVKSYPASIRYLQTISGRLLWSFVPLVFLLGIGILLDGWDFIQRFPKHPEYFAQSLAVIGTNFIIFTFIHLCTKYIYLQWSESRDVRLWSFGSIVWVIIVILFVFTFDPYDTDGFKYIGKEEFLNLSVVTIIPPIFLGVAVAVYRKYIR